MELGNPFEFEFFRRGLIAALLVGGVAGLTGTYVVLRGMSYIGHGLAHAVFGGAVVGYMIHLNFYVGAGLWGILAAWLIHGIGRRRGILDRKVANYDVQGRVDISGGSEYLS